jgi:hypothetical protein
VSGWPGRILGPVPGLKEINLICWGLFLFGLVLPIAIITGTHRQAAPEPDFVYFYSLGRILNEHPPEQLYNYELQKRICADIQPLKSGMYGPNPYPPFLAILFRPFARLPFVTAYRLWMLISLLLYLTGLAIISVRCFPGEPLKQSLIFCFALSFYPFVMATMFNGHLSAIGFLALAMVFREDDSGRLFLSGLALSACLYKPTLLLLLLPMLLTTRRYKALLGFAAGALTLVAFTIAIEGIGVWSGYLDLILYFRHVSTEVNTPFILRFWKYVDIKTFSILFPGGRSRPGLAILLGFVGWAAFSLFRLWRRSVGKDRASTTLLWATTLTWTILLNIYYPMHDCIVVVLSIAATTAVLKDTGFSRPLAVLWLLICASSWITERVAEATGVQIITLLFSALGILQLIASRKLAAQFETPSMRHRDRPHWSPACCEESR